MFTGSATSRRSSRASRGRAVLPLPPQPGQNQPQSLPGGRNCRTKGVGFTAIPHYQALFVGVFNPCHRAQSRAKGHSAEGICNNRAETWFIYSCTSECTSSWRADTLQLPAWHGGCEHPKSLLSPAQVLEFCLSPRFGSPTL